MIGLGTVEESKLKQKLLRLKILVLLGVVRRHAKVGLAFRFYKVRT
jgi:hypothetical protein